MKTSTNVRVIENYILGKLDTPSKLLFEAKMLIDPTLMLNVQSQRLLYTIIQVSGRQRIKSEIEEIHNRLFSDPEKINFRRSIYNLFIK